MGQSSVKKSCRTFDQQFKVDAVRVVAESGNNIVALGYTGSSTTRATPVVVIVWPV